MDYKKEAKNRIVHSHGKIITLTDLLRRYRQHLTEQDVKLLEIVIKKKNKDENI